jgi:boron transporter
VTGPVSILTISIYTVADSLDINFLPFYAWSQIWAAFFHVVLAAVNFCELITLITRFSVEIFGCLIAVIYIYTGVVGVVDSFQGGRVHLEEGLLHLLIALGTAWLAMRLSEARHWKVLSAAWRDLIADYGPTASLVVWSAVPLMGLAREVDIAFIDVPSRFETTSGRGWLVDLTDIERE